MRKYSLPLFFLNLLVSALVIMAEANTRSFEPAKTNGAPSEEKDPEMETIQETDVFPDIISFAMRLYQ